MTLVITSGEPAGIGPDIVLQAAASQALDAIVLADMHLLENRAQMLGLSIELLKYDGHQLTPQRGQLSVSHIPLIRQVVPGKPHPDNASYLLEQLQSAVAWCQDKTVSAMVTLPICKATINQSGTPFSGHTEYLADLTKTDEVVMMLASKAMRVALVTTHLPLSDVPKAITKSKLKKTIDITLNALKSQFHITSPCIAVAGLNPHAGEGGFLGREEIDIIEPVLDRYNESEVQGPFPADTLFTPDNCERYDTFLAMYHDQGLSVLKYASFGESVNITLGLPIIRTSVDHGTAFPLAGTGRASQASFLYAYQQAQDMSQHDN